MHFFVQFRRPVSRQARRHDVEIWEEEANKQQLAEFGQNCTPQYRSGVAYAGYHAIGVIGTALSKQISVFQSNSRKGVPITSNALFENIGTFPGA